MGMKIRKIRQSAGLIATVIDVLTSTSKTDALSANQGRLLNQNKLDKSGGNITGSLILEKGFTSYESTTISKSSGSAYHIAKRTDTDTEVWFGVGSGGVNHGIYTKLLNNWLIWSDNIYGYLLGNIKFDISGNLTVPGKVTSPTFDGTATKAKQDGNGNTITNTYQRLDGGSNYIYLKDPNGGATKGYRKILTQNLKAWANYRMVLAITSRHNGCGILCMGISLHSTIDSYETNFRYYGSACQTYSSLNLRPYYNATTGDFTLIWQNDDYTDCCITVISRMGFNAPYVGEWFTTLGTYGSSIPIKQDYPITLYDNAAGTTGTITLNASAADYSYLEIFYSQYADGTHITSTKIHSPNGKNGRLCSFGSTYLYYSDIQISGTSVTRPSYTKITIANGATSATNEITIYRIIGWK